MRRSGASLAILFVSLGTVAVTTPAAAADPPPGGGIYAYLENPGRVGENQEPQRSRLLPYSDAATAARGSEQTPFTRSLDGQWRLSMAERPEEVPAGFYDDGYDTSGWPTVTVPHTWQTDGLDHPIFRNIATEVQPDNPPNVPRDVNPTGAYVRDFALPADWDGRRTVVRLEGVTSAYFVWVNGRYIGYDQGGYTPAEFDLTEALRPGTNRIALQVHRWSAGSYLEDVDQWRYSGIFRSVTLYSTPATHVEDVTVRTDLDSTYTDAVLTADVEVGTATRGSTGTHRVAASLRTAGGTEVGRTSGTVQVGNPDSGGADVRLTLPVRNPAKWTDETPTLYSLVLTLTDPAGAVRHITSESIGFREIEVRNRQVLINGRAPLFKGVNRAETDPDHGRHVPRAAQERDVALMEQLNVNAVRSAHYPSDQYFYDLADRHGLWITDAVDIETHNYENCEVWCQANQPQWRAAFLDRLVGMVERSKNHPSVFMWDTGNEAGLGAHHYEMADWLDANEPTRPVYHQSNRPDGDAPFADVWGPRYPSPERFAEQAANTSKPIISGEYAHAMGNSLGNFREFWEVVRANPHVQGGFIWDWAEQNIRQPLRIVPDRSGNNISAHITGLPDLVPGRNAQAGQALDLSGLDDFVEVYRDRRLDITNPALTVDAWVKPGPWSGEFTVVTKGDHQYSLKMRDRDTLEFFVHGGTWRAAAVRVPSTWYADRWHRISGVYDGSAVRLYINGTEVASTPYSGPIDRSSAEVNIGRDFETSWNDPYDVGRMAHGTVDDVAIHNRALRPAELAVNAPIASGSVLALDFDTIVDRGEHLSYGSSLSGIDGLIGADRDLQPETLQMAWAHQPIRFGYTNGTLSAHNERRYSATNDLQLRWRVTEGSRVLSEGNQPLRVAAGATGTVRPSVPSNAQNRERFLVVEAVTTQATATVPAGHVVARDQFGLGGTRIPGVDETTGDAPVQVTDDGTQVRATVGEVRYTVNRTTGTLSSVRVGNREIITQGPSLGAWRAPISNETFAWGTAEGELWRQVGLDRLATQVRSVRVERDGDREVRVVVDSRVAAPDVAGAWFDQTLTYSVNRSGALGLSQRVTPQGSVRNLPYLPRIGIRLGLPANFDRFSAYARVDETYVDRRDGSPIGVLRSTVDDQYVEYHRPQDNGNHTDARWALLSDGNTGGLLVSGVHDVSVTAFDDLDRAAYPFQLQRNNGWVTLHADRLNSGVGDTPNPVRTRYRVAADQTHEQTLTLRPLTVDEARAALPSGG